MASKARRNFRRDTKRLAEILSHLPAKRLEQLEEFADHQRNNEWKFHLGGFLAGIGVCIRETDAAGDLQEFKRIFEMHEARTSPLRLISLLSDALRLAMKTKTPFSPEALREVVPNLSEPMTKRILNGM